MPGPPPNGASSTERCLSRAKSRMSTVSSRQMPGLERLAGERIGERPRQHFREDRQHRRAPGHRRSASPPPAMLGVRLAHCRFPPCCGGAGWLRRSACVEQPGGGSITSRPASRSTTGTTARVNGTITGGPPARSISSVSPAPKSCTARTRADRRAVGEHRVEPDQIGVVVFLLVRRRQRRARQIEAQPAQRLGAVAVVDPGRSRRSARPWRCRRGAARSAARRSRPRAAVARRHPRARR